MKKSDGSSSGYGHAPTSRKGECYLHRLGVWIRYDSDLERRALLLLDASPSVKGVRRSESVQVHSPSGAVSTYTPDFDVDTDDLTLSLEIKPNDLVASLIHAQTVEWRRRTEVLAELGRPLHIVVDTDLGSARLAVAEACMPFFGVEPSQEVQEVIRSELKRRASIPLNLLRQLIRGAPGINASLFQKAEATLRHMVARGDLTIDLAPGQKLGMGIVMLTTPRTRPAPPIGRLMVDELENPSLKRTATPVPAQEFSLITAEARFLSTSVGRQYEALYTHYCDPNVRLSADLVTRIRRETGLSRRNIFRFRQALLAAGAPGIPLQDVLPHLPAFCLTHRPTNTVDPRVSQIIRDKATASYWQRVGYGGRATTMASLVLKVNQACRAENLPAPAYETVKRHVLRMRDDDPVRFTRAREGDERARQMEARMGHLSVKEYGALWAVDCSPADVFTSTPDDRQNSHRFRPRVVTVIDTATGQVLRSTSFPHGVGANEILHVLQGLFIGRAEEFRTAGAQNVPQAQGLPVAIRMDSGREFDNQHVARVLRDLGIQVVGRNKGTVHFGGLEERTIGSLNRTHHSLPGTTMSNITARAGYDAKVQATIDMAGFQRYQTLMVEQYNLRPAPLQHASRQDHAARLIGEGRCALRPPTAAQRDYIQSRMFVEYGRLVERAGVSLHALKYRAVALAPLAVNRVRVNVSYDPGDIRTVNVIHPTSGAIITAITRFPQDFADFLEGENLPVPQVLWDAYRQKAHLVAWEIRDGLTGRQEIQAKVLGNAAASARKPRRALTVQQQVELRPAKVNTIVPATIEIEVDPDFDREA